MTEIFSILISLFTFILISTFPVNYFKSNKLLVAYKINFFDILSINLVILLNILLILSFFALDLKLIFLFYILVCFLFFLFNFNSYILFFRQNKIILFLFFIIIFFLFVLVAQFSILTWDGAAHWLFKAQNFYQGSEYKNLVNLPMNYYPHLGSYVWAFFWKNSLLKLEYFGRFFFIFILIISIFSLGQQLNKNFSILEKALITFVLTCLSTNLFLFGGYQEYLIFFIFFFFSRLFCLLQKNKKYSNYIFFLLLLTSNLVLWVKQEGFFYYIFLCLICMIHTKNKFFYKFYYTVIILILLSLFISIKIHFFGSLRFNESVIHSNLIDNLNIIILFKKVILILKYILISFIKYPIWIIIIFSSIVLFFKYNFFNKFYFLYTFGFLSFALIFLIYIQTKEDISFLLPLTLSRLVFPISGFFAFLIIELLNKFKN
jgi:hypothetical protein